MIENVVKRLTDVLRHHGVELHPDDIKGLAHDAVLAMREATPAMVEAANGVEYAPWSSGWTVMIDSVLAEGNR
jgi:hypothetical protein